MRDQNTGFDLKANDLLQLFSTHIFQSHNDDVDMLNFWDKLMQKFDYTQDELGKIPTITIVESCFPQGDYVESIRDIWVPSQVAIMQQTL